MKIEDRLKKELNALLVAIENGDYNYKSLEKTQKLLKILEKKGIDIRTERARFNKVWRERAEE